MALSNNEQGLLKFNIDGALAGFIAAEEHSVGNNTININSWCLRKHLYYSTRQHHLAEMISLIQDSNPEMAKQLKSLSRKIEDEIKNPSPTGIRNLRNEFRYIVGEETYSKCKDKVCSLDRLNESSTTYTTQSNNREENQESPNYGLWLLGGLAVVGVIFLLTRKE